MTLKQIIEKMPPKCVLSLEELNNMKLGINEEQKHIQNQAKVFKSIANPIRLSILKLLSKQEMCVCVLSELLKIDQTLVSHHLSKLKTAGLVTERVEARWRFYKLRNEALVKLLEISDRITPKSNETVGKTKEHGNVERRTP